MMLPLGATASAFDSIAADFDARFGAWSSVTAQRRAVRAELIRAFPAQGRILELGGGTGEDAAFLASHGFQLLLTDPSPSMIALAGTKLAPFGSDAVRLAAEEIEEFACRYLSSGGEQFDGTFSNFAPLNCVHDLKPVARGLAKLLKPGASAMLVLFGTFCPGEMVTEALRGRLRFAFRRWKQGQIPARLAHREFHVVYHRHDALKRAFAPWFAAGHLPRESIRASLTC
jgi:SAM-dependent methyltransferase